MLPFAKLHGCGNDYVHLDGFAGPLPPEAAWPALARALSDRHRGIGGDGLIIIRPAADADAEMVMFNADGSRSEMCGNGIRCAAKLAFDRGHVASRQPRWSTGAGVLALDLLVDGGRCLGSTVGMGRPRLTPADVPVVHDGPGPRLDLDLAVAGHRVALIAVGMGNPHAVCEVEDPARAPVAELGPLIERHPRFPNRTNVEFVRVRGTVIEQRTWERGSGETQACGTGACAATVAMILAGRLPGRAATVRLLGGELAVRWSGDDADVAMTGPAELAFTGVWPGPMPT